MAGLLERELELENSKGLFWLFEPGLGCLGKERLSPPSQNLVSQNAVSHWDFGMLLLPLWAVPCPRCFFWDLHQREFISLAFGEMHQMGFLAMFSADSELGVVWGSGERF